MIPSLQGEKKLTLSSFVVYLTGATLFLSLLLARVFYITLDLITIQDELNVLKGKVSSVDQRALETPCMN